MFFPDHFGEPYDYRSVVTCGIGQQLTKVVVISLSQLILDNDRMVAQKVFGQQVQGKVADVRLTLFKFELKSESLSKSLDVVS